jgi:hypothetical protein
MVLAFRRVIVPPSRPVNAAVNTRELFETFMVCIFPFLVWLFPIPSKKS